MFSVGEMTFAPAQWREAKAEVLATCERSKAVGRLADAERARHHAAGNRLLANAARAAAHEARVLREQLYDAWMRWADELALGMEAY